MIHILLSYRGVLSHSVSAYHTIPSHKLPMTLLSCGTKHQATKQVLISHLDQPYHYIDCILTNIKLQMIAYLATS